MVRVAVLGGSGHVGKTVVEVLSQDPRHSVVVLGRNAPKDISPGIKYIAVDYSDNAAVVSALEDHQVHTVISCLMLIEQGIAEAQTAVIKAAEKATSTHRFIASNWGPPTLPEYEATAPWFPYQLAAHALLRTTSLEWTEIATGYFLDYWGMPHIKTNMDSDLIALDIVNGVAGIPGTGNEPVAFTYTYNVATVVAEVVDQPAGAWRQITYVVGDKITWNEFMRLAEEARGFRFQVAYDSEEKLAGGEVTELPNHVESYHKFPKDRLCPMYACLGLMMARGAFDLNAEKAINKSFPHLEMLTVRQMLQQIWKK